ncbi:MAG TPA: hypothetical protein VMW17_07555 [Candidatus Binatia bacterium]|nr:hypothetical protein [Candidatus Binatia bacterium]
MKRRGSIAVIAAAVIAPLAVHAQQTTGTVTIGPTQQAPTLSFSLIALLAVALAGVALYRLRVRGPIIALVLIVVLAATGYARLAMIRITGGECAMETMHMFLPGQMVMCECSNGIRILDIQLACDINRPPNPCMVGEVLMNGQSCTLPECVI